MKNGYETNKNFAYKKAKYISKVLRVALESTSEPKYQNQDPLSISDAS